MDKTPYLVISGGNVGKIQRFYFSFEISALVLVAIDANCRVLVGLNFFFQSLVRENLFSGVFCEKGSRPIRSLDFGNRDISGTT